MAWFNGLVLVMSDIIERAESLLDSPVVGSSAELVRKRCSVIRELVAELKAKTERLDAANVEIAYLGKRFISLEEERVALLKSSPARTFTDDQGRRWEWCGGQPGTWAWRVTDRPRYHCTSCGNLTDPNLAGQNGDGCDCR